MLLHLREIKADGCNLRRPMFLYVPCAHITTGSSSAMKNIITSQMCVARFITKVSYAFLYMYAHVCVCLYATKVRKYHAYLFHHVATVCVAHISAYNGRSRSVASDVY